MPRNIPGRLPWVQGLPPPYQPPTLAVGFTPSSINAQTATVNSNGRTQRIQVPQDGAPVQLINDTIEGQVVIQLVGGGPVWIGFSNTVTIATGFRLVIDDPYTMREIIPVWAVGIGSADIPPSLVQVSLVE